MPSPHVKLGNTAQDIGAGISSFIKGQEEQQTRMRQIALQEALAKSSMAKTQSDIAKNTSDIGYQGKQGDYLDKQGIHLGFEDNQLNAQTHGADAMTATHEQENLPADLDDEDRYRQIEPDSPIGIFRGMTKAQANEHIKIMAAAKAARERLDETQARWENRGVLAPTPTGGSAIVRPNLPGGGTPEPVQGVVNAPVFNAQQHGTIVTNPDGTYELKHLNRPGESVEGTGKPTTSAERNYAGAAQALQSAHEDLTDFESTHLDTLDEVAKAIALPNFARLLPFGVGSSISDVLQSFRLAGMSPEGQAYMKRMFDFAGIVGPIRYGKRGMQERATLQQIWTDFGAGQFKLGEKGLHAAEKNRLNAIGQMRTAAGHRAWEESQSLFPADSAHTLSTPTPPNRFFVKPPEDDLYDF